MPFTDVQRLEMYSSLRQSLGDDVADTLMEHLPPNGWFDVAQASVVNQRFDEITRRFEHIDRRFEAIDRRFEEMERRLDRIERRLSLHATIGLTIGLALIAAQVQVILSVANL